MPLLTYPAARRSVFELSAVILVFTVVTLLAMLGMVAAGYFGLSFLKTDRLARYVHAFAGATLFLSGIGIVFLSL